MCCLRKELSKFEVAFYQKSDSWQRGKGRGRWVWFVIVFF